jgi:hypothetical protein
MNKARFEMRFSSVTAVAQKVFHAVPKEAAWPVQAIHGELARKGQNIDRKIVEGCLTALMGSGLVTQPTTAAYRQVKVKEAHEKEEQKVEYMTTPKSAIPARMPPPPESPAALDRLASLANRARQMMDNLKALADDIETTALEVTEQMAANEENAQKLKQLQALLKSLG